jgi:hypothetical protein
MSMGSACFGITRLYVGNGTAFRRVAGAAPLSVQSAAARWNYNGRSMLDVPILQNFVGGRWTPATSAGHLDVFNPARGRVIARTPCSAGADVDAAVTAA